MLYVLDLFARQKCYFLSIVALHSACVIGQLRTCPVLVQQNGGEWSKLQYIMIIPTEGGANGLSR